MKLKAGDVVEVRYPSGARWGIIESMRDDDHAIICFEFEVAIAEEQRLARLIPATIANEHHGEGTLPGVQRSGPAAPNLEGEGAWAARQRINIPGK